MVSQKWKGKELLDKLELASFFLFYSFILLLPYIFGNPDPEDPEGSALMAQLIFNIMIIVIAFYVVIFVAIQQYIYRKISDKYSGKKVMTGWIDLEEDLSEEYELKINKMTPYEKLSENEKNAIDRFMKDEQLKLLEFDKEEEMGKSYFMIDRSKLLEMKKSKDNEFNDEKNDGKEEKEENISVKK